MADTLTNLQTRVRRRADRESDPHIVDAELTAHINASYKELWDLLVAASADYFLTSEAFTLTGSTDTRALPADFYKIRGLDDVNGEPIPRFTFRDRNRKDSVMYRVMGGYIRFTPRAAAAGTYTVWYEPGPTALSSGSDALNTYVDMWDEYIVIDAAIKCMVKSKEDASVLMAEKAGMIERIKTMASSRDDGETDKVTDIYPTILSVA